MKRRKIHATGATAALALGFGLPAKAQDEPLKVGIIYVGPTGDYGWSYQQDQGRKAVEDLFGDRVESS